MSSSSLKIRLTRGGPFTADELTTIARDSRFDTIQIDGKYYNEGVFQLQAKAAYAKSVVFGAAATVALRSKECIWSAIACYYALFHLSIALMFLLPRELEERARTRLIKAWASGSHDPTSEVPHRDISKFLRKCGTRGLSSTLWKSVEAARELRVHVNYGPRIVWVNDRPIFRSLSHSPAELEPIVNGLEAMLTDAILWASRATDVSWVRAVDAAATLNQFLTAEDLLFVKWCSTEVLVEARRMAQRLPNQLELWRRDT